MTSDSHYIDHIFEQILDQNRAIFEAIDQIFLRMETFVTKDEFHARWDEINAIKMVVRATNKDVADHEQRITKLEKTG